MPTRLNDLARNTAGRVFLACVFLGGCSESGEESEPSDTVAAHLAAARAAAGDEHVPLYLRLCIQTAGSDAVDRSGLPVVPDSLPSASPDRPGWYAEPVQVFDNLYWVGETRYSAWAVTTSDGIIIIDPLWDYSVEGAIVEGLEKLGLDPRDIRYVLVSHAHRDHVGGARPLQLRYGARVVMGPEDWDLLERTDNDFPEPERDIEAFDGYELTLGETTLTSYAMPGHTPGTISTLIPVSDGGTPHLAALPGGTAFNFMGGDDDEHWFRTYIESAERFAQIARDAGADVLLSNHPQYDGSTVNLARLATRRPGDPHPYVIGAESLGRYFTVATECARVALVGAS